MNKVSDNKSSSSSKKKNRRQVSEGIIHIHATFNNTIVTISDLQGNVLSWASAGGCGFKGSKKSTPFAAQIATDKAGKAAKEFGIQLISVMVQGPGPGRDSAIRAIAGLFRVIRIVDVMGLPHNGCRPQKQRRT